MKHLSSFNVLLIWLLLERKKDGVVRQSMLQVGISRDLRLHRAMKRMEY